MSVTSDNYVTLALRGTISTPERLKGQYPEYRLPQCVTLLGRSTVNHVTVYFPLTYRKRSKPQGIGSLGCLFHGRVRGGETQFYR